MKKNKLLYVSLALLLVAAMAGGTTVAWFTDSETVTNKASVGALDVELEENVTDPEKFGDETDVTTHEGGKPTDPVNPKYTVPDPENEGGNSPLIPGTPRTGDDEGADYPTSGPGTSYMKQPTVTNVDQPAFIRLVVERKWVDKDGKDVDGADAAKIILHKVNATDWTYAAQDGKDYFYYDKEILTTGAVSSDPFDYFTISSTADSSYAGLTAQIVVKVEAVQAAGMGVTKASDIPATVWAAVSPAAPVENPPAETPAE